ncbi:flavin reductase [Streptomyces sp. NPDC001812]|uniref:Flavin reductase n=2 Tax=Streptomyces TaxID=1883 RepID=A0ABY8JV46_9ACTN|nr:flavin reductase [Streptomyces sp. HUAS 5]WGD39661.1 flavin reductase [Streptomyces sp. HUAS 5]
MTDKDANEDAASPRALEAEDFLEVTSQVPSGACVMAAWNRQQEPVGTLLTGFTPVSQAPPSLVLVVLKDAPGVEDVRRSGRCSVAVLSEDQDALLRALSLPGGLGSVEWRVTPQGSPVLDGVAGWLDCRVLQTHETSDTVVVVAEAIDAGLAENRRPMLRYQGGFGQFVPGRLSSLESVGAAAAQRVVELAREPIEVLARDLGVECSVITYEEDHAVAVAVANHSSSARRTRLGSRIPVVPPLGIHFAANPGSGISEDEWLAKLGDADAPEVDLVRAQLARVRERGWSITLSGPLSVPELDELVGAYSESSDIPEHTSALVDAIRSMAAYHEPEEILSDEVYDVIAMSVPVRSPSGAALAVLRLLGLPPQVTGSEVLLWLSMLLDTARSVEALLEPRPITSRQALT